MSTVATDQHAGKGLALSFAGGFLLSFDVPLLKLSGADTWTIVYVRGLMLFIAMYVFWTFFRRIRHGETTFVKGPTGYLIAVLAGTSNVMFVAAISLTSVANVVFILAFNPMFAGILSWLFLGERLKPPTWAAILVSLLGVLLIVGEGLSLGTWRGDLLALGVAFFMATVLTIIRRARADHAMSAAAGHLLSAMIAAPLAAPASLHAAGWGWLAINGLIVAPLSNALLIIGPRYIAAAVVAMFFLLETVLTPVWMWAIFAEIPSGFSMIGGIIVISTLATHSIWRLRTARLTPTGQNLPNR